MSEKFNLLNINSIIFLSFIIYKFFLGFDVYGFIVFIITILISFFIFNNFKFSKNIFINIIQKIVVYNGTELML